MMFARSRNTVVLSLLFGVFLFGTAALIQAQDQQDSKPAPDNRPEATKPSQQDEPNPKEAKPSKQNEDNSARPKNDEDKAGRANEDKNSRNEDKAKQEGRQEDNRSQAERGGQPGEAAQGRGQGAGGRHGHIPDDKFRASFGHEHRFKMQRPTVVGGQPTFQYGGYSFVLVDAWPMDWAYTDDCYIDYIDGEYFLIDLAHPGVRLAIFVVM